MLVSSVLIVSSQASIADSKRVLLPKREMAAMVNGPETCQVSEYMS